VKVTINVDRKPAEAREFCGLPDLRPLQAAWLLDRKTHARRSGATSRRKPWREASHLESKFATLWEGFIADAPTRMRSGTVPA
jgi:hypothetical protein